MMAVLSLTVVASAAVPPPGAKPEAEVYATLIQSSSTTRERSIVVVKDVAVLMPTLIDSSAAGRQEFDRIPAALVRLAGRASPTSARRHNVADFPAGTRLVPEAEIQAIFERDVEKGWTVFKRRYASDKWLSVSEVLLTDDALEALVYYETRCGGLCGEGGYAWLHRDLVQSRWLMRKKIIRWKS
jgi:hypothetical protein